MSEEREIKSASASPAEREKQKEYFRLAADLIKSRFSDPPKAFVHTYGCQANVADGERLRGTLARTGYAFTDDVDRADLILLNACAVRESAENRVFGNIGALKNLKLKNRNLKIIVCGCMAQRPCVVEKIRKSYPFVDIVFGTGVLSRLPEFLYKNLISGRRIFESPEPDGVVAEELPVKRESGFKALIPVIYGCDNFCSYCIVPYVRGRERSRDPEIIVNEARELIGAGYKEITLLGQNVNSYGGFPDRGCNFASLLERLNALEGDFIIRFTTSHPKDCTRELIDAMAKCEKVAKHLHLPFQSGSDRVLKAMNRRYTREQYLEILAYAYSVMPGLSVTSDVIVGFPGETREDFEQTVSLVKEAGFTSIYSFIFSPREGTAAAKMPDPVTREEKGERFRRLLDVQKEIAAKRSASMVGNDYRVLCEGVNKNGLIKGRSSGNVIIEFPAPESVVGAFRNVRVTESLIWILRGELV